MRELGNNLFQNLQSLSTYLRGKGRQSRNIPARSCQACNEPRAHRVVIKSHDNGNGRSCFFGSPRVCRTSRDDEIHVMAHQLGRKYGQSIRLSLRITILNDNILSFNISKLTQTLAERLNASLVGGKGCTDQISDPREFLRLLRLGSM